jgi:predicted DNA-binding transcriptional regulator YafY
MRGSRLLSLVLLLQAKQRCTAAELAEALCVSERTIYRDLDALAAAGIPVYGLPGPGGGYALVGGYQTKLTGLTAAEAEALFLLDPSNLVAALGMEDHLSTGRRKLMAALPSGLRDRTRSVGGWVHIDLAGWFEGTELPPSLPVLAGAVVAGKTVRFGYGSEPDGARRHVHPLGLVLKGRSWYLVAARGDRLLTYAVPRVHDPVVTEEPSRRPDGFDLPAVWAELVTGFETQLPTYRVRLRVDPAAARRLRRSVDTRSRDETDWGGVAASPEPVELEVTFEHIDHACNDLLALGAQVEVLAPAELRGRLASAARALARLYDSV